MENSLVKPLEALFENQLKISAKGLDLTKLQGDASYRIYYRAQSPSGGTFIVMKMPAGKASASEEITNLKEKPTEPPFIDVGRFLKAQGLPVPEIHGFDLENGLIVLEDLGDETLEKRISGGSEDDIRRWYQRAIDLLIDFQKKGSAAKSGCIAHKRSFDATLLNWEFDHFIEYGIEARNDIKIPEDDRKQIQRKTGLITEEILKAPKVLVHRDFQSRNLMIQDERLHLLDFQDALLGPLAYDLVALLRDSYITLPWTLVSELIDYYLESRGPEPFDFRKLFDEVTIQRKLKDAGRFVYIDRVKGNPNFMKSIPSSLSYVREAFERRPECRDLYVLLKKYVPEFR